MTNAEIFKFFPEPIFKFKFEEAKSFNKKLSEYIYGLQKDDPEGTSKSNKGGWHSKNFKLNDKNSIQFKFALELQKYISKTFQTLGWKT